MASTAASGLAVGGRRLSIQPPPLGAAGAPGSPVEHAERTAARRLKLAATQALQPKTMNTQPIHWAIVGPGSIAHKFAEAVASLPGARLRVVHGRDLARAQAFATQWSADAAAPVQATTDWADLLANPAVDAVYIATPHAQHSDAIERCLRAGKHVLCEKPLVVSAAQAKPLIALAQAQGVLLMEALWSRFLPAYAVAGQWLQSGAIGRVRALQSCFCFVVPEDASSRLYAPELAGGALLDAGVYNLSLTRWALEAALGQVPALEDLQVHGVRAHTGVDRRVSGTLAFEGGIVSQFVCGFDAVGLNALRICGDQGWIELPHNFWAADEALLQRQGEALQRVAAPHAINGFEGEIEEAMRCIRAGQFESPRISHADTLATLGWMDMIRAKLGLRYPFE